MIRSTELGKGGVVWMLLIAILCNSLKPINCQQSPSLLDYTPKSGPISGGTRINVTGDGFITTGAARSKCRFQRAGRGNMLSNENLIHNETLLTCIQPEIEFLTDTVLAGGNKDTRLTITGGPGIVSNSVEFFLYDLDLIRVWSISPTEGLVNSTNITLSVQGENFLNTNEATCSVAGSYKVPARYINSSFIQCQLAPYPETAQVTIGVSLNGQAVANIVPLTNNSTTFTYFASPPEIQSCRFTPSYAQLLLSFDRGVEIGREQQTDTAFTSSSLSCSDIFMRDTLQNVIGTDSVCCWQNTLQRHVVVQLASENSVQLGSTVTIQNNTIRTRYVEYSRLASGSVEVSPPNANSHQFLPEAVIEAPSVIPFCGNFTVNGAKSQYGGSRGLEYKWTIGTTYDENNTLIQDTTLSEHVPTSFTSQSVLELSSDLFNLDLFGSGSGSAPIIVADSYDIELTVRNFLGFTSTARVSNISIAETAAPSVIIVGGDERNIRISDETILEGRIIFHDGCLMQDEIGVTTYTWSVVDQFGSYVDLESLSRTSVLILPPYLLEVDYDYTATLTVGFSTYSVIVNASVRLVTDVKLVDLDARIRGGIRKSVGISEDIELDGRPSKYVNTSSALLGVVWTCVMIESDENSIERNCQTLSFSRDSLVQIIPSGTLQPGEYNFTLTLSLASQSQNSIVLEASVYQVVVIFPYSVPRVEIIPDPGTNLESVLVNKELILNVAVQSDLPGVAQWTSEYVIGYAQVDFRDNSTVRSPLKYNITNVVDSQPGIDYSERLPVLFTADSNGVPSSFINQVIFIVTANTLLPQNAYRLKFSAIDILGNGGFAEVDIFTESTPTSGRLLIDPQNGSPLITVFSLSAPSWTDDFGDTPLLYQFGVRYIFFTSIESSNSLLPLPPCCNLFYDNKLFSMDQFENISCVCDFISTGISEQNEILTTLPFQPSLGGGMGGVSLLVQQLVRVFDKNGAISEETKTFDGFNTENVMDRDDSTQLLQPLSESQREEVDAFVLLDGIREMSRSNWREALAQLTTLVSFAEVNSLIRSSYINLTLTELVRFKVKATELVLDIYTSYIPVSKSYLNVIAALLHSTTSSPGIHETTSSDVLISRVMDFLQVLVDTFNRFDEERVFSSSGFSTSESQIMLQIFQNLIRQINSNNVVRIRENLVTRAFLSIIPKLGLGLCMREEYSFVDGGGISFLKASRTNLPTVYQSTEECPTAQRNISKRAKFCLNEVVPKVMVDFSSSLFNRYLWWPCRSVAAAERNGEELYCSGVCLTSVQHTYDFLWQGSPYESHIKSPLFQLYLLNQHNGSILEVSPTSLESQTRMTRNSAPGSGQIDITFPILNIFSNASNLQCVYWNGISRLWIRQSIFSGETIKRNGTVTGKMCHFRASLGSVFTVLESCPDGQYGETCLEVCPEGLWGAECLQSCDCNNRGDCSPVDGSCDCNPGWQGDICETRCLSGMWGKDCLESCLCENGADCDHVTGFCTCTPGWIGTFCNISCPDGFYGNECREECACNAVEECNKITGFCKCNSGFTGPTCHQMCLNGFYGEGCASECQCFTTGTRSCHHINGSCDCLDAWTGDQCNVEVEVTPPPEPAAFQIWQVVIGLVAAVIIIVVAVVCAIIIIVVCVRIKKRKKVLPITDGETGDQISHQNEVDNDIATTSSGSDLNITFTKAQSLEVLIPTGKELKDIFISQAGNKPGDDEQDESEFKEPLEHEGKLRWQIIRLLPTKSRSPKRYEEGMDTPATSAHKQPEVKKDTVDDSTQPGECNEDLTKKEGDPDSSLEVSKITQDNSRSKYNEESRTESEDDHMTEIVYRRGVYLAPDATLKDLRNSFIELEKLELSDKYFHLLKSDVPGDVIDIDTEDEVLLSQIEHTMVQPRTMYIENIDPGTVTMELCVCGKFADLECSECRRRGYCSVECQQDDWFKHAMVCQENIAEERRKRRKSSKSKKKKKKHRKHKKHKRSKSRESRESRESIESRESRHSTRESLESRESRRSVRESRHSARESLESRVITPSVEVCICGNEAEFECSGCEKQGYCSEECQRNDWDVHHRYCKESVTEPLHEEEEIDEDDRKIDFTVSEYVLLNRTSLETLMEETEESEEDGK